MSQRLIDIVNEPEYRWIHTFFSDYMFDINDINLVYIPYKNLDKILEDIPLEQLINVATSTGILGLGFITEVSLVMIAVVYHFVKEDKIDELNLLFSLNQVSEKVIRVAADDIRDISYDTNEEMSIIHKVYHTLNKLRESGGV